MTRENWCAPRPFARLVLVLTGAVWLSIGVLGLLSPLTIAGWVGFAADNAMGRLELRAMYGGLGLALGALHAVAATRAEIMRTALWASMTLTAGLAAGRALSLIVDASAPALGLVLLAAEVVLIALLTTAALRLPRHTAGGSTQA